MILQPTYSFTTVEPGANERIQERLKDIPKINSERPCTNCKHYYHYRLIRCGLPLGQCDFHHSAYEPISQAAKTRRNKKLEDTGYNQS